MMTGWRLAAGVLLVGLLGFGPPGAGAQDAGSVPFVASPYLHLRHPLYREIDLLVERGILTGLSPVVRPYARADVARAVARADTARAGRVERAWLARLRRELRPDVPASGGSPAPPVSFEGAVEATGMTQRHRDPLRPTGDGLVTRAAELGARAVFGSVAVASRLRSDNYYVHDPQFPDRVAENRWSLRAEDAYVEFQGRHARLMLGRLYRNWAPSGVQGTLLSDYAYSFDQAALWVGGGTLGLSLVAARLDDFPGDVRRYLYLHRLDWQPSPSLALYAAEAVLSAGVARTFELEFLNPLNVWIVESDNQRSVRNVAGNNVLGTVGFWWRAKRGLIGFGEVTLDDIKVDPGAPNGTRYAFYAGVSAPRVTEAIAARLTYAQVSSLAYRSFADYDRYSFRDVGLGRDVSDFDHLRAEATWFASAGLRLAPAIEVLRRGEGDFREPWPSDFDRLPRVLSGVVETTVRVSVGGRLQAGQLALFEGVIGANFVTNTDHVRDRSESEVTARLGARIELRRPAARP